MNREPAWVAAIRLALFEGEVDVESVIAEANLIPGRERTVEDVLETMVERDLLVPIPDEERYRIGPNLMRSAPSTAAARNSSRNGVHRWVRPIR